MSVSDQEIKPLRLGNLYFAKLKERRRRIIASFHFVLQTMISQDKESCKLYLCDLPCH